MESGEVNLPEGYELVNHQNLPAGYTIIQSPGLAESFGRGALNNFPLAKQAAAALMPGKYSPNLEDLSSKAAMSKIVNPVSYGAGAVTGTMAPLAIPGVGEALGAESMGTRALAGGALGAANAIGDTDVVQNPGEAAKQALEGGITGGALGAVMPTGEKASDWLEGQANKQLVRSAGIQPGEAKVSSEWVQDTGNLMHQLGADKGTNEEKYNLVKDALQQTGAQIGDLGQGKVLADPSPYHAELQSLMQESANLNGFEGNSDVKLYQKAIDNIRPGMTFDDIQSLKMSSAKKAFDKFNNVKPNGEAYADVNKVYSDALDSLSADHPEYQDLKKNYALLKDIKEGFERQAQNEIARGAQTHGVGMMGRMGGAITGGNVPLTLGAAALVAPAHPIWGASLASTILGNPAVLGPALRAGAEAMPGIAKAATVGAIGGAASLFNTLVTNPQAFGKHAAPLLQAAKDGGSQGFAAANYIKANTDPEYADMVRKMQEQSNDQL